MMRTCGVSPNTAPDAMPTSMALEKKSDLKKPTFPPPLGSIKRNLALMVMKLQRQMLWKTAR